jgi:hypothetical protein
VTLAFVHALILLVWPCLHAAAWLVSAWRVHQNQAFAFGALWPAVLTAAFSNFLSCLGPAFGMGPIGLLLSRGYLLECAGDILTQALWFACAASWCPLWVAPLPWFASDWLQCSSIRRVLSALVKQLALTVALSYVPLILHLFWVRIDMDACARNAGIRNAHSLHRPTMVCGRVGDATRSLVVARKCCRSRLGKRVASPGALPSDTIQAAQACAKAFSALA